MSTTNYDLRGADEAYIRSDMMASDADDNDSPRRLAISRLIPNLMTLLALCAGLTAIRFGINERWAGAIVLLLVAAVLDGLDGMMARLLNSVTRLGAQLDSLSDFLSFGVAPALMMYLWGLSTAGAIGWCACLFFVVAVALRLARYNVQSQGPNCLTHSYFSGVPAPAGAILGLMPMVLSQEIGGAVLSFSYTISVWLILVAALMISRIPTFSLKKLKIPVKHVTFIFAGFALVVAALITEPWITVLACGGLYLGLIPVSVYKLKAK